MHYMACT
jgi:hypothetical protein